MMGRSSLAGALALALVGAGALSLAGGPGVAQEVGKSSYMTTEEAVDQQTLTKAEAAGYDQYRRGFYEEAMATWKEAVEKDGDVGSAYRLGREYMDAKVVERDMSKSVDYLTIASDGGDPRAQFDLGTLYDNGWGVEKDPAKAASLYEGAAEAGLPDAQYNVGVMYQEGVGVEKDPVKAYKYYLLAVQNGFPRYASTAMDTLSQTMEPAQIKQATELARDFKPRPVPGEAS